MGSTLGDRTDIDSDLTPDPASPKTCALCGPRGPRCVSRPVVLSLRLRRKPVGNPHPTLPRMRGRVGWGCRGGRDPQNTNTINGLRLPAQARNEDANDKA